MVVDSGVQQKLIKMATLYLEIGMTVMIAFVQEQVVFNLNPTCTEEARMRTKQTAFVKSGVIHLIHLQNIQTEVLTETTAGCQIVDHIGFQGIHRFQDSMDSFRGAILKSHTPNNHGAFVTYNHVENMRGQKSVSSPTMSNCHCQLIPTLANSKFILQRLPAALVGLSKMFSVRMPDVILLQECATVFLLQLLDEPLGEGKTLKDYYPYHHSGPEEGSRNQILSKHPIVEKGTAYGFPLAKINVGGFYPKYIHIVSVHLAAFYGRTHARVQEWDGIRKALIKKNIPKTEPILIGGDFNAEMFEVLKMQDAVVNYDFTKQDIFDEEGKFFPASWSVKTNWRILLVRYPEYPKRYGETFDYVVTLQSHLQPSLSKEMKVLLLKFDKSWEVYNDGQNPIEGKYPGYKFLINGTWVENPDKTNKFYNDLADHYPVYQEYVFRLDKSLL